MYIGMYLEHVIGSSLVKNMPTVVNESRLVTERKKKW